MVKFIDETVLKLEKVDTVNFGNTISICQHKAKVLNIGCKQVLMIDKNSKEIIKEFNSATEAAKYINKTVGSVSGTCRGLYKTCGGYIFKYKNNLK